MLIVRLHVHVHVGIRVHVRVRVRRDTWLRPALDAILVYFYLRSPTQSRVTPSTLSEQRMRQSRRQVAHWQKLDLRRTSWYRMWRPTPWRLVVDHTTALVFL